MTRIITSVFTASLFAYFIDIIWHYNKDPCMSGDIWLLFISVPVVSFLLISLGGKLQKKNLSKSDERVFAVVCLSHILLLSACLLYVIYGRDAGPWTSRQTCMWLGPAGTDYVFDLPIGLIGLFLVCILWIFTNLNFKEPKYRKIQRFCLFFFPVLILLLYLASLVPVDYSLFSG